ncbi:MAG: hypothetical protein HKN23_14670 [Verrucomicrobiales bacterium]|nr:hypothetical protein [Verrucomicrobiales bacterium]
MLSTMNTKAIPGFLIGFSLAFSGLSGLRAQEKPNSKPESAAPADAEQEKLGDENADWLEYYYKDPTPEKFVEKMKIFSADGTLSDDHARPALIGFISQVVRQNRDRVEEWYRQLSGLPAQDRKTIHTGLLFSRTKEADEILKKRFGPQFDDLKANTPKVLELPLDRNETMDMLWGYFYATGSESAIRRMIYAFRFDKAPDDPEGVEIPEGFRPLYKELPSATLEMIVSNARRHPKILEICKKIYKEDKTLILGEKEWLYDLLSRIDPKAYPPRPAKDEA